MAYPTGSVRLSAPVGVGSSDDTFGTHYDTLGIGGYRSVADQSAMTSIKAARRTKGMLVRNNTNTKIYIYISDDGTNDNTVTNATDSTYTTVTTGWKELQLGSSSGSGTLASVTLTEGDQINIVSSGTSIDPIFTFSLDTIPTTKGGTNITSYATGDILYSNATDTLAKLSKPSVISILSMNSSGVPSWLATSTFEVPLTFENGLTRNSNTVKLGGDLTADTTIALTTKKLRFSSTETSGATIFDIYSTSTTLLDLKSDGTSANFFSTKEISIANNAAIRTTSTSVNTDSIGSGSTFYNNTFNNTITTLTQGKTTSLYLNDTTVTLPQRSGTDYLVYNGASANVLSLLRYKLTNTIFNSSTSYTNKTSNIFQVYTTGFGSNLYGTSAGPTYFTAPGIASMVLSNPGQTGILRFDVGSTTSAQGIAGADGLLSGSDITISGSTLDTSNVFAISAYLGQSIAFALSTGTYSSSTQAPPTTVTTYATISAKGGFGMPSVSSATGSTNAGSAFSTTLVGKESRPLSWKMSTWTGSAGAGSPTVNYGRPTTSYFISKSYPHYSSVTGYYDFRTRWILFQNNSAGNNNNNAYPTEPTFYNGSNLLDGGSSGKTRALDILAGQYSTNGSTLLGGQVAVGVSLSDGEVPSAKVTIGASTTAQAALRFYSGSTPSSPQNGDMWFDGTNLKIQIGGSTKTITVS
jgi:hypothetical protein